MINQTLNLNAIVSVRLTEDGIKQWRRFQADHGFAAPDLKIAANGTSSLQLWELMQIFGPMCWLGNPVVAFEGNEILI